MLAEIENVRVGSGAIGFRFSLDSVDDKLSQDDARSSIDWKTKNVDEIEASGVGCIQFINT